MKAHIESIPSENMLASLDLAIYEAELVRAFVESEKDSDQLQSDPQVARKMLLLDREIHLLKAKQCQVLGGVVDPE